MKNRLNTKLFQFYNNNTKYFDHMDKTHDSNYFDSIFRLINNNNLKLRNNKILDVGCGAGSLAKVIKEIYFCKNIWGIDISKLGNPSRYLNFIRGSADDMPIEDESFDYVFCSDVLEHVIDPKKVIFESCRVLKNGGYLIIRTPNGLSPLLKGFTKYFTFTNIVKHYLGPKNGLINLVKLKPNLSMNTIGGDLDAVHSLSYTDMITELKLMGLKIVAAESWGGGPRKLKIIRFLNFIPFVKYLGSSITIIAKK